MFKNFGLFGSSASENKGTALDFSSPSKEETLNGEFFFTTGAISREIFARQARGATIETSNKKMIDLCSQTQNCILGQNDPWVLYKQIAYMTSGKPQYNTIRLGSDVYNNFAVRLKSIFQEEGFQDPYVNYRMCSGSDVVELAIHAAYFAVRAQPTRKKIASFKGSYHGQGVVPSIVSDYQSPSYIIDDTQQTDFTMFDVPQYEDGGKNLSHSSKEILQKLQEDGDEYVAVIIEPIQTRNGMHEIPIEFLVKLREVCTEKNICLIFDECQTGFGWLGSISAAKSHGVTPDIAVYSKALTAGYGALGLMVAEKKYRELSPTQCSKTNASYIPNIVAADAVLDRLLGGLDDSQIPKWIDDDLTTELKNGLMISVNSISEKIETMLENLKTKFPNFIGKIKGSGLVRGIEIIDQENKPREDLARWIINHAFENGIYCRQSENCIIIKPPLVISDEELNIASEYLEKIFDDARNHFLENNYLSVQISTRAYHR